MTLSCHVIWTPLYVFHRTPLVVCLVVRDGNRSLNWPMTHVTHRIFDTSWPMWPQQVLETHLTHWPIAISASDEKYEHGIGSNSVVTNVLLNEGEATIDVPQPKKKMSLSGGRKGGWCLAQAMNPLLISFENMNEISFQAEGGIPMAVMAPSSPSLTAFRAVLRFPMSSSVRPSRLR